MQVRTVGTPSGKSTGIFLDGTSNPSHACIDGQLESWKRSIVHGAVRAVQTSEHDRII